MQRLQPPSLEHDRRKRREIFLERMDGPTLGRAWSAAGWRTCCSGIRDRLAERGVLLKEGRIKALQIRGSLARLDS